MPRYLLCLALALMGCTRLLGAPVPMSSVKDPLPAPGSARCLLVFLPGVLDSPLRFRENGFVDELRRRGLKVDAVAADATVGYYMRGTDARRIERDVVSPALTKRYEQVWMVGISMGGFGALHYASTFPSQLDGLLLLSPHLGEESVVQTIRDAGSLKAWTPPIQDRREYTVQAWSWLRSVAYEAEPGPQVYLGYGNADPVVASPELLVAALPPSHVMLVEGGHSWPVWKRLWSQFLDQSDFARHCN